MNFKATDTVGGVTLELSPENLRHWSSVAEAMEKARAGFRLRKLLVPVDFSEGSKKALEYALPLAEQHGAELTLLYAAPPVPPAPEFEPVDTIAIEEGRKLLETLQAQVGAAIPTNRVVSVLRKGEPDMEIVGAAEERGVDLIVLSTHGRTGLARVLAGSTAEKVVRHAQCPVLVVRQREPESVEESFLERGEGE